LAWLYFNHKLYAQAQKYIDRALAAVDPNTPAATLLEHAGDIYRAQGNFYQAEKFYRRALEFSAGDPECDPARVEKKLKAFK
ncbi:MAG: tetratricopeptide repeat protein, partial [Lentisphaeria bacterium]|nr:tetratricopeptide repeat protein [Lentisphaeria bacterium]